MGILSWLIIGAIAGWIASIITGRNKEMGFGKNIVYGVIGGVAGGAVMNLLTGYGITGFNIWSLFVSIFGACVLIWFVNAVKNYRKAPEH
jgi:uncharacterized membrane protein YeaQ/YmgE (transglycosylase-associated protein family)